QRSARSPRTALGGRTGRPASAGRAPREGGSGPLGRWPPPQRAARGARRAPGRRSLPVLEARDRDRCIDVYSERKNDREDKDDRRPAPPDPAEQAVAGERERDEERLRVDAEAVPELLE